MRIAQGFTRRIAPPCFAILSIAFLLWASASPGIAARTTTSPTCAPPGPPPVPGSPVLPPATPGIVLFNEILTNPGSNWNCSEPAGTYSVISDSWVELFNPHSQPFNLYAVHAYIDTGPNTFRFYLPFGAAIAPQRFLVVFPNSSAGVLLASSNLRLMFGTSNTAIDQVSIPGLAVNDSYARIPDGSSNWRITTTPTIDAPNIEPSSTTPTANPTTSSTQGTTSSTSSSGSSGSSGPGGGSTHPTPVFATGTQPAWNKLSFPPETAAASSTASVANSPLVNRPPPTSSSGQVEIQRRILLTAMLILLAGALFWCWKVYSS